MTLPRLTWKRDERPSVQSKCSMHEEFVPVYFVTLLDCNTEGQAAIPQPLPCSASRGAVFSTVPCQRVVNRRPPRGLHGLEMFHATRPFQTCLQGGCDTGLPVGLWISREVQKALTGISLGPCFFLMYVASFSRVALWCLSSFLCRPCKGFPDRVLISVGVQYSVLCEVWKPVLPAKRFLTYHITVIMGVC